ncbi:CLUMA_CG017165, isoform A [Clunio marinus]|uniref:CLUMA_CG017165, isoform A n=1 Tax=Clunio marinus TaxID=568069 RepID=A0A1J1IWX2_9DIPT|nr:CLUMA_CG017165, isoform A [Clunio marinus]
MKGICRRRCTLTRIEAHKTQTKPDISNNDGVDSVELCTRTYLNLMGADEEEFGEEFNFGNEA